MCIVVLLLYQELSSVVVVKSVDTEV